MDIERNIKQASTDVDAFLATGNYVRSRNSVPRPSLTLEHFAGPGFRGHRDPQGQRSCRLSPRFLCALLQVGEWQGPLRYRLVLVRPRRRYVAFLSLPASLADDFARTAFYGLGESLLLRAHLTRTNVVLARSQLFHHPRRHRIRRAYHRHPVPQAIRDSLQPQRRQHHSFRRGSHSWILGSSICPWKPFHILTPSPQVSFLFIDKWGRKPIQLMGFCVLTVTVRGFFPARSLVPS